MEKQEDKSIGKKFIDKCIIEPVMSSVGSYVVEKTKDGLRKLEEKYAKKPAEEEKKTAKEKEKYDEESW